MTTQQLVKLEQVPFHGDTLDAAVLKDGKVYASVKRICESLGLAYSKQLQRLKGSRWATMSIMDTVAQDGRIREQVFVDLESLPMWLATISVNKVVAHVRPKIELYQREAKAVLSAWFLGRSTDRPDLAREFTEIKRRLTLLEDSNGIYRAKNRQIHSEIQAAKTENRHQKSRLDLLLRPFGRSGGDYMTLADFCKEYQVCAKDGRPALTGRERQAISRKIAAESRKIGVPIHGVGFDVAGFGIVEVAIPLPSETRLTTSSDRPKKICLPRRSCSTPALVLFRGEMRRRIPV